ncbi:MAG: ABC transporter permease [Cyanomargarita calcarea GSE-NOS-MK-12-04C]|jgi:cbb3-type cytochrome oxidase subunit 3|uniref:ABC transporter permease n=1 Tax=Cyanomargarita calcarea GSE-NOS-MK-12-04C TaxID=2839659 RepID=A0A951QQR9_9CYAN|nr:ABC transporter permease [Cyanomargarita calcarea GSE-NOS-MK-12-04C]
MGQEIVIYIATFILFLTGLLLGYILSQLVLGFLQMNLLTFLGTLSLIIIFGTLYYVLFWEFRKQQSRTFAVDTRRLQSDELVADTNKNPDPNLQTKLVKMLAGDTAQAERLIEQSRQDHPAKPENWYWERAIADLERDRR